MQIDAAGHLLATCGPCGRVFSITTLPIELAAMSGLIKRARCPRCDAGVLTIANEGDAALGARQRDGQTS